MAWIEVHQALRTHKKTMKAVSLMKFKMLPEAFVGHLTCLWLWCIDNAPDGILPDDTDMIDMSAGCPTDVLRTKYGCPEDVPSFTEILRLSGYIDNTDKGLELHDWEEYTGKLILQREADRLRKQAQRESTKTDIKIKKLSGGSPKDVQRMSAGTQPNPTQPNITNQSENDDSMFMHKRQRIIDNNTNADPRGQIKAMVEETDDMIREFGIDESLEASNTMTQQNRNIPRPVAYTVAILNNKRKDATKQPEEEKPFVSDPLPVGMRAEDKMTPEKMAAAYEHNKKYQRPTSGISS